MPKKHKHPAHENLERWLISYADFITLLFAVFVALWALKQDNPPTRPMIEGIKRAFNVFGEKTAAQDTIVAMSVAGGSPAIFTVEPMFRNIEEGMKKIGIKGSTVSKVKRGIIIRIPDEALFEPGRAEVKADFKEKLNKTGELIKDLPNQVQIEGHTDNIPINTSTYPSNWELSTGRAAAIMHHFVDNNAIAPARFAVAGYSEYHPIDTNDTAEGRSKNRRIDILIVDSDNKTSPQAPSANPGMKGVDHVEAVNPNPVEATH